MYVMDRNPARCIIFFVLLFVIFTLVCGFGGNAGKPLCVVEIVVWKLIGEDP